METYTAVLTPGRGFERASGEILQNAPVIGDALRDVANGLDPQTAGLPTGIQHKRVDVTVDPPSYISDSDESVVRVTLELRVHGRLAGVATPNA